ncbi:unnamed protein product [Ilex paraguariensis]|uniref:Wax synthase domain-containing protein n=1 Tax=Ilex paraguariensis TaxID=185542 RepID=A0ABC8S1A4_9AQUA
MALEIINIIKTYMEGEISICIKVYLVAFVSLSYCYFAGKIVPKGTLRLFTLIPVICLNLLLPLPLHTMHLGGSTAFFLAWLANFKLLLFASGKGPLSDPSLSLPRFIALACLPIKIQQATQFKNTNPSQNPLKDQIKENPSPKTSQKGLKSVWNYAIKCLLIAIILRVYEYSDHIHPYILLGIYSCHIYFGLEIVLAIVGGLARALLGIELEPQFDEPYLSSSLQDFWGRRWNIMVTRILHPTVYLPVLQTSARVIDRKWAPLPAIFSTFMVSALMHELIFYYLGRMWPTWELTCFFLLHGVCLMVELVIKKAVSGRWRLPLIITGPCIIGFVMVTAFWLFFPQFLRCNSMDRAIGEYTAMGAFVRDVGAALTFKSVNNATRV